MSSCTNIYVEYKDSRDNLWHLLKAYVPLEDREYDRKKSEEELSGITEELEGKPYFISNSIERYGIIRDLLTDTSKRFFNRGFPNDLSIDLENILKKQQEEIDKLNQEDKDSGRLDGINHDWRYAKSWCYLSELGEAVEKSYNTTRDIYLRDKFDSELNKVYRKLSEIYDKLSPPVQKEKLKSNPWTELSEDSYDYTDELDDLIYAKGFCDFISNLVEFITGSSSRHGDIRLVYYTE